MGKAIMFRPGAFKAHLLEFMKKQELPLNTSQICRIRHGAKGKHDIKHCRENPYKSFRDVDGFKNRGGGALYENCKTCSPGYQRHHYFLGKLEEADYLESRMEYRTDPIVPGAKDRMRMWAMKGKLPSIEHFTVDETKLRTLKE